MDLSEFSAPDVDAYLAGINWSDSLQLAAIFAVLIFGLGAICRSVFGRGSSLTRSISASLNVILIYLSAVALFAYIPSARAYVNTLPFLSLSDTGFRILDLSQLDSNVFFSAVVQLALLCFLVNTIEAYTPKGKTILSWYFFRLMTCLCSFIIYYLLYHLIQQYIPQLFQAWAKPALLIFWGFILLSAVLKLFLTLVLSVFNPVIGGIYAFFFSNLFGKQFSKSILTTFLLLLVNYGLNQMGFYQMSFSDITLATYGLPSLIFLFALYFFGKLL